MLNRASAALAQRARAAGVELDSGLRCKEEAELLLATLSSSQREAVLADLDDGAGNPRGDLKSAVSSALLAVNAFGAFVGRSHFDELLNLTLSSPRFERKYPVTGVRTRPDRVPNLDVVQRDGERAVAIESKLLEPWRAKPSHDISSQYDKPAERFSSALTAEMGEIREGRYELLDAAQVVKHLLGLHSAVGHELPHETVLVLLHWEPTNGEGEPLVQALRQEARALRAHLSDGPIPVQLLSYQELWEYWLADGQPDWLRAHAEALADRYAVDIRPTTAGGSGATSHDR